MAGLTGSRNTPEWNGTIRKHYGLMPVEAATSIYVGGMVCRDAKGNAVPAQVIGATPLDRLMVMGVCEYVYCGGIVPPGVNAINQTGNAALFPGATATLGTAGAVSVGVVVGIFGMDYDSTISAANVGELVFASNDHTVSLGTAVANTTALAIGANTNAAGASQLALTPNIVPGSFVVTQNTGGTGTLYSEGTDYTIDYRSGYFYIVPGGALVNLNANVFVSYSHSAGLPVAGRLYAVEAGMAYVNFEDKFIAV